MLTPEQIEVARSLARLAEIDLATAEKLAPDPEIDDRPVGFHAQQAVEKAVKVALILAGADEDARSRIPARAGRQALNRHGTGTRIGVLAYSLGRRISI